MHREFERGKWIVTGVSAIILFVNGLGLWLSRTWLLTWHGRLIESLQEPMALLSARALRNWLITNQESFFTNHGVNYAITICFCLMLFLGFNWLRWLWAIYWIARGLVGIVAVVFFAQWIGPGHIIFGLGLVTALLYIGCGSIMFCSPSVNFYMQELRPPYAKRRLG